MSKMSLSIEMSYNKLGTALFDIRGKIKKKTNKHLLPS